MKVYSFFADKIVNDLGYITDPREIRHIKVLRLKKNDPIRLMDDRYEYFGIIQDMPELKSKLQEIPIKINEKRLLNYKPRNYVHAFVAIIKNMHEVVSALSELGVEELTPVISRYSLKTFNRDKFISVAKDSAKQSLGRIMKINLPCKLEEIKVDKFDDLYIFLEKNEKERQNIDVIKTIEAKRLAFLIGPEAGFSEEERKNMHAYSLGEKILRSETAAIVAASLLLI